MFHKIRSITPIDDYKLIAVFCEGVTKVYDITPLFERIPIFNKLKENNLFYKVKVDMGGYGIIWNSEIDLACDELFYNGKTIESSFGLLILLAFFF